VIATLSQQKLTSRSRTCESIVSMQTKRIRKRSPPPAKADSRLPVLVQTHVSTEVGAMLAAKLERLRVKQAHYVRTLIERDLGLIQEE